MFKNHEQLYEPRTQLDLHQRHPRIRESKLPRLWSVLLIVVLVLLVLIATPTFRAPVLPGSSQVSGTVEFQTENPEGTVSSGIATINHRQQFCFALGTPVAQGGDFRFAGGIYGSVAKLDPAYRISPMDSRELSSIDEVPDLPAMTGFRGFFMGFYCHNGYDLSTRLVVGQSYSIACADKTNYAMIRVLEFDRIGGRYPELTFEWAYQANGSPVFYKPELTEVSK